MSYSAFFTAGLTLASQPRDYDYSFSKLPPLQIHVHPGTPCRTRKRRSSLTVATSPISTVKSPTRVANDAARSVLRSPSPRDATFLEAFHNGTRPRRKTVGNLKDLPSHPAPTIPLPTIPNFRKGASRDTYMSSTPKTPIENVYPSSPISSDSPRPAYYPGSLRSNPARKSSLLLPMVGRGALFPSTYNGNIFSDNIKHKLEDARMAVALGFDDDEVDMKEIVGDV